MATLSQLYLARAAATKSPLANATARFTASPCSRASFAPIHGTGIPSLQANLTSKRNVFAAGMSSPKEFREEVQLRRDEAEAEVGSSDGFDFKKWLLPGVVGAGFLTAGLPAHAVIMDDFEEMMRFSPEAWVNIYITTGISLVLYFVVIPLVVYNYLRLRWYKRNFWETYFQFLLVFIFFPGMLLLAPFINFRRLPKDGAEEP